ncbi:MAG: prephenate dehydrogenase/arogenate dehydrogenase family protein, partial [Lachnospiraceae bacterium]|nr:prephenate dehydrogenase/arogenate dehydrogenase family protein [Lachnospiraceae bacterium]
MAESTKRLKVAFLGLGLIGGSIAMTVRRVFPNAEIIALNRSEIPLNEALKAGVIDVGVHEVDDIFKNCDFIFLCMPVNTNISYLKKIEPYLTENTILTDVGSVKGIIHEAVEKTLPNAHFIGGHPMAGSEKSGFSNANDRLIENTYFILTPSKAATEDDVKKYKEFVSSLDSIPLIIPP